VEKFKKPLQIQVRSSDCSLFDIYFTLLYRDNMCQFLTQDKVHDFARFKVTALLVKTVEAMGDPSLVANWSVFECALESA